MIFQNQESTADDLVVVQLPDGTTQVLHGDVFEPFAPVPAAGMPDVDPVPLVAQYLLHTQAVAIPQGFEGRLEKMIIAYLKEVRDRKETFELLVRPRVQGGLEISRGAAEALMQAMIEAVRNFAAVREKATAWQESTRTAVSSSAPYAGPSQSSQIASDPLLEKAEKAVTPLQIADDLKPRAVKIVLAYLKEVRDEAETRRMMESPRERGGVGLSGEAAEKVMQELKAQSEKRKTVEEDKDKKLPITNNQLPKRESTPPMSLRGVPQSGATKQSSAPSSPSLSSGRRGSVNRPSPMSDKTREAGVRYSDRSNLKSTTVNLKSEILNLKSSPVSTDMAPKGAMRVVAATAGGETLRLAPTASSGLAQGDKKKEPQIAIPRGETGRPKMQDVAYTPKVMSPVDELREMRMIDFRRLGRDPQHAAEKIIAKIELLGEEDAAARVKAVKALKESPLYKEYMEIVSASVARGTAPAQVVEERLAQNKEAMRKEEFGAILGMGRGLRG